MSAVFQNPVQFFGLKSPEAFGDFEIEVLPLDKVDDVFGPFINEEVPYMPYDLTNSFRDELKELVGEKAWV